MTRLINRKGGVKRCHVYEIDQAAEVVGDRCTVVIRKKVEQKWGLVCVPAARRPIWFR